MYIMYTRVSASVSSCLWQKWVKMFSFAAESRVYGVLLVSYPRKLWGNVWRRRRAIYWAGGPLFTTSSHTPHFCFHFSGLHTFVSTLQGSKLFITLLSLTTCKASHFLPLYGLKTFISLWSLALFFTFLELPNFVATFKCSTLFCHHTRHYISYAIWTPNFYLLVKPIIFPHFTGAP